MSIIAQNDPRATSHTHFIARLGGGRAGVQGWVGFLGNPKAKLGDPDYPTRVWSELGRKKRVRRGHWVPRRYTGQEHIAPGMNCYTSLAAFRDAHRWGAENVTEVLCLTLDDVPDWRCLPLPPNLVAETSPNNFQVTYVLRDALAYRFERVYPLVARAAGADLGGLNVRRLIRVPGGYNCKASVIEACDGPWQVRLVWDDDGSYTLDDILGAYGIDIDEEPPELTRNGEDEDGFMPDFVAETNDVRRLRELADFLGSRGDSAGDAYEIYVTFILVILDTVWHPDDVARWFDVDGVDLEDEDTDIQRVLCHAVAQLLPGVYDSDDLNARIRHARGDTRVRPTRRLRLHGLFRKAVAAWGWRPLGAEDDKSSEVVAIGLAIRTEAGAVLVKAPMGGGKTYAAAGYALERCDQAVVVLAAPTYTALDEFWKQLVKIAGGVELLGGRVQEVTARVGSPKIRPEASIILTTYAYFGRRGIGAENYGFVEQLKKIKKKLGRDLEIVCDEIDQLLRYLYKSHWLGVRVISGPENRIFKVDRCPVRAGAARITKDRAATESAAKWCSKCHEYKGNVVAAGFNRWAKSEEVVAMAGNYPRDYLTIGPYECCGLGPVVEIGTHEIRAVESVKMQSADVRVTVEDDDGNEVLGKYDAKFLDQVNEYVGLRVSVERPRDLTDNVLISADQIAFAGDRVKWPRQPCGVPVISGYDLRAVRNLFSVADRTVVMTGTASDEEIAVLQTVMPELTIVEAEGQMKKIDEVLLVVVEPKLQDEALVAALIDRYSIFWVAPYVAAMRGAREINGVKVDHYADGDTHQKGVPSYAQEARERFILHTALGTSVCRGLNLPQADVAIVDCDGRIPLQFQPSLEVDEDLPNKVDRNNLHQVMQTIFRHMRPRDGAPRNDRTIVLHGLPETMSVDDIVARLQERATRVHVLHLTQGAGDYVAERIRDYWEPWLAQPEAQKREPKEPKPKREPRDLDYYKQMVADAKISGLSWQEFRGRYKRHINRLGIMEAVRAEWDRR